MRINIKQKKIDFTFVFSLFSVFLIAFLIRLLRYNDAFFNGKIVFLDADTYYHLRMIHFLVQNWPHLLHFDWYFNFPNGAGVVLPPGFDFLIGTTAYLISFGKYSKETVDLVAAIAPSFLGALTIFPIFWTGKLLFQKEAAWISVGIYTLLFGGIWPALFGKPDHHVAESFLVTLLAGSFIKIFFISKAKESKTLIHNIRDVILFSVLLSLCQLIWRGAIMYTTFFFVISYFTFLFKEFKLRNEINHTGSIYFVILGTSFILSAIEIYPWCATSYYGSEGKYVYFALSLFQPNFYLFLGSIALVTYILFHYFNILKTTFRKFLLLFLAICFFSLVLLMTFSSISIFKELVNGINYLFKSDVWMQTIVETQPLFSKSSSEPFNKIFIYFGYWFFLFFPGLIYLIFKIRKVKILFFTFWSLFVLFLTINQIRYCHQLTITIALFSGWFLSFTRMRLLKYVQLRKNISFPVFYSFLFIFLIWLILTLPVLNNMIGYVSTRWERENSLPLNLLETLTWIKQNTPSTSYFQNPNKKPEYSILSLWDYGNWILYLSQRPVIASNFGFLHKKGLIDSCRFLLSNSKKEIQKIIINDQIRYVLLGNFFSRLPQLKAILNEFVVGNKSMHYSPAHSLIRKLFFLNFIPEIHRNSNINKGIFRLVYESPVDPHLQPPLQINSYYKVFEFVPGAILELKGNPNQSFSLNCSVKTNRNTFFIYQNKGFLDENGKAEIAVPYSTANTANQNHGLIISSSYYDVQINTNHLFFRVSEKDIYKHLKVNPILKTDNNINLE